MPINFRISWQIVCLMATAFIEEAASLDINHASLEEAFF
jgi:hypothetical protein